VFVQFSFKIEQISIVSSFVEGTFWTNDDTLPKVLSSEIFLLFRARFLKKIVLYQSVFNFVDFMK
jgi:hypothetical protein